MRSLLIVLGTLVALSGAARAEDAILVLDASGSMWGQIEGKTKVEIARAVVGNLLKDIPADRRLGLVAYGHRREADCTDIEEIVPVGADREAIRKAVNALAFKGKTPLTAAVRFAAEKLRYKEQKATVILVTDGIESCNADPCALGAELEAAGIDFTTHIVGFGLANTTESAGLKCLAEATGGKYYSAKNASELSQALAKTIAAPIEAPPAPKTATITLRATDLAGGPEVISGLTWTVTPKTGAPVFVKANAGVTEAALPPGEYEVTVVRASDGLRGRAGLSARAGGERTLTIALELKLEASLAVTPAAQAPVGSKVAVKWTGPNRAGDYITIVKTGALVTDYLDYEETKNANPVEITLPAEPGDYEMRYVLGRPQRVLASAPLKLVSAQASLTAPQTAPAGGKIAIGWTGPGNPGDWITVVKPDAPFSAYNDYFDAKPGNRELTMPTEPGDYELRYVLAGKSVIARTPIKVVAAQASLTAPQTAPAGAKITIAWTGPGNPGDWITVVKPDALFSAYNDYFDAKPENRELTMPIEPGDYELRYVLGGKSVIGRAPIKVTAVSAAVQGPASIASGASFDISWTGPNYPGDWLTIVAPTQPETAYASYVDANRGTPAKLAAPAAPGGYELRYVLKGKKVIARRAIQVTAH
jgi:Ca-activated chloride channel family protein